MHKDNPFKGYLDATSRMIDIRGDQLGPCEHFCEVKLHLCHGLNLYYICNFSYILSIVPTFDDDKPTLKLAIVLYS